MEEFEAIIQRLEQLLESLYNTAVKVDAALSAVTSEDEATGSRITQLRDTVAVLEAYERIMRLLGTKQPQFDQIAEQVRGLTQALSAIDTSSLQAVSEALVRTREVFTAFRSLQRDSLKLFDRTTQSIVKMANALEALRQELNNFNIPGGLTSLNTFLDAPSLSASARALRSVVTQLKNISGEQEKIAKVQQSVADLRQELQQLQKITIGIDVDDLTNQLASIGDRLRISLTTQIDTSIREAVREGVRQAVQVSAQVIEEELEAAKTTPQTSQPQTSQTQTKQPKTKQPKTTPQTKTTPRAETTTQVVQPQAAQPQTPQSQTPQSQTTQTPQSQTTQSQPTQPKTTSQGTQPKTTSQGTQPRPQPQATLPQTVQSQTVQSQTVQSQTTQTQVVQSETTPPSRPAKTRKTKSTTQTVPEVLTTQQVSTQPARSATQVATSKPAVAQKGGSSAPLFNMYKAAEYLNQVLFPSVNETVTLNEVRTISDDIASSLYQKALDFDKDVALTFFDFQEYISGRERREQLAGFGTLPLVLARYITGFIKPEKVSSEFPAKDIAPTDFEELLKGHQFTIEAGSIVERMLKAKGDIDVDQDIQQLLEKYKVTGVDVVTFRQQLERKAVPLSLYREGLSFLFTDVIQKLHGPEFEKIIQEVAPSISKSKSMQLSQLKFMAEKLRSSFFFDAGELNIQNYQEFLNKVFGLTEIWQPISEENRQEFEEKFKPQVKALAEYLKLPDDLVTPFYHWLYKIVGNLKATKKFSGVNYAERLRFSGVFAADELAQSYTKLFAQALLQHFLQRGLEKDESISIADAYRPAFERSVNLARTQYRPRRTTSPSITKSSTSTKPDTESGIKPLILPAVLRQRLEDVQQKRNMFFAFAADQVEEASRSSKGGSILSTLKTWLDQIRRIPSNITLQFDTVQQAVQSFVSGIREELQRLRTFLLALNDAISQFYAKLQNDIKGLTVISKVAQELSSTLGYVKETFDSNITALQAFSKNVSETISDFSLAFSQLSTQVESLFDFTSKMVQLAGGAVVAPTVEKILSRRGPAPIKRDDFEQTFAPVATAFDLESLFTGRPAQTVKDISDLNEVLRQRLAFDKISNTARYNLTDLNKQLGDQERIHALYSTLSQVLSGNQKAAYVVVYNTDPEKTFGHSVMAIREEQEGEDGSKYPVIRTYHLMADSKLEKLPLDYLLSSPEPFSKITAADIKVLDWSDEEIERFKQTFVETYSKPLKYGFYGPDRYTCSSFMNEVLQKSCLIPEAGILAQQTNFSTIVPRTITTLLQAQDIQKESGEADQLFTLVRDHLQKTFELSSEQADLLVNDLRQQYDEILSVSESLLRNPGTKDFSFSRQSQRLNELLTSFSQTLDRILVTPDASNELVEQIRASAKLISDIADAATLQATAQEETVDATQEIADTTRTWSKLVDEALSVFKGVPVEQVVANMEQLAANTKELADVVASVKKRFMGQTGIGFRFSLSPLQENRLREQGFPEQVQDVVRMLVYAFQRFGNVSEKTLEEFYRFSDLLLQQDSLEGLTGVLQDASFLQKLDDLPERLRGELSSLLTTVGTLLTRGEYKQALDTADEVRQRTGTYIAQTFVAPQAITEGPDLVDSPRLFASLGKTGNTGLDGFLKTLSLTAKATSRFASSLGTLRKALQSVFKFSPGGFLDALEYAVDGFYNLKRSLYDLETVFGSERKFSRMVFGDSFTGRRKDFLKQFVKTVAEAFGYKTTFEDEESTLPKTREEAAAKAVGQFAKRFKGLPRSVIREAAEYYTQQSLLQGVEISASDERFQAFYSNIDQRIRQNLEVYAAELNYTYLKYLKEAGLEMTEEEQERLKKYEQTLELLKEQFTKDFKQQAQQATAKSTPQRTPQGTFDDDDDEDGFYGWNTQGPPPPPRPPAPGGAFNPPPLPAPAQTSPVQTTPAQTSPAQTAPAQTSPAQTAPAQTGPTSQKSAPSNFSRTVLKQNLTNLGYLYASKLQKEKPLTIDASTFIKLKNYLPELIKGSEGFTTFVPPDKVESFFAKVSSKEKFEYFLRNIDALVKDLELAVNTKNEPVQKLLMEELYTQLQALYLRGGTLDNPGLGSFVSIQRILQSPDVDQLLAGPLLKEIEKLIKASDRPFIYATGSRVADAQTNNIAAQESKRAVSRLVRKTTRREQQKRSVLSTWAGKSFDEIIKALEERETDARLEQNREKILKLTDIPVIPKSEEETTSKRRRRKKKSEENELPFPDVPEVQLVSNEPYLFKDEEIAAYINKQYKLTKDIEANDVSLLRSKVVEAVQGKKIPVDQLNVPPGIIQMLFARYSPRTEAGFIRTNDDTVLFRQRETGAKTDSQSQKKTRSQPKKQAPSEDDDLFPALVMRPSLLASLQAGGSLPNVPKQVNDTIRKLIGLLPVEEVASAQHLESKVRDVLKGTEFEKLADRVLFLTSEAFEKAFTQLENVPQQDKEQLVKYLKQGMRALSVPLDGQAISVVFTDVLGDIQTNAVELLMHELTHSFIAEQNIDPNKVVGEAAVQAIRQRFENLRTDEQTRSELVQKLQTISSEFADSFERLLDEVPDYYQDPNEIVAHTAQALLTNNETMLNALREVYGTTDQGSIVDEVVGNLQILLRKTVEKTQADPSLIANLLQELEQVRQKQKDFGAGLTDFLEAFDEDILESLTNITKQGARTAARIGLDIAQKLRTNEDVIALVKVLGNLAYEFTDKRDLPGRALFRSAAEEGIEGLLRVPQSVLDTVKQRGIIGAFQDLQTYAGTFDDANRMFSPKRVVQAVLKNEGVNNIVKLIGDVAYSAANQDNMLARAFFRKVSEQGIEGIVSAPRAALDILKQRGPGEALSRLVSYSNKVNTESPLVKLQATLAGVLAKQKPVEYAYLTQLGSVVSQRLGLFSLSDKMYDVFNEAYRKRTGENLDRASFDVQAVYDFEEGVTKLSASAVSANGAVVQLAGTVDELGDVTIERRSAMRELSERIKREFSQEIVEEFIEEIIYGVISVVQEVFSQVVTIQDEVRKLTNIIAQSGVEAGRVRASVADYVQQVIDIASETGQGFEESIRTFIKSFSSLSALGDVELRGAVATDLTRLQVASQTVFNLTLDQALEDIPAIFAQLQDDLEKIDFDVPMQDQISVTIQKAKDQLADLFDLFVIAGRLSSANYEDIITVYTNLMANSKGLGLSMQDLVAFSSVASVRLGTSAEQTSNSIKYFLERLYSPERATELASLGIYTRSFNEETGTVQLRPFIDVFKDLYELLKTEPEKQKILTNILGETARASEVARILGSYQDFAALREGLYTQVTGREFEQEVETKSQSFQGLMNAMKGELGSIYQQLLFDTGVADEFAKTIYNVVNSLSSLVDTLITLAGGAEKAGPVLSAIGQIFLHQFLGFGKELFKVAKFIEKQITFEVDALNRQLAITSIIRPYDVFKTAIEAMRKFRTGGASTLPGMVKDTGTSLFNAIVPKEIRQLTQSFDENILKQAKVAFSALTEELQAVVSGTKTAQQGLRDFSTYLIKSFADLEQTYPGIVKFADKLAKVATLADVSVVSPAQRTINERLAQILAQKEGPAPQPTQTAAQQAAKEMAQQIAQQSVQRLAQTVASEGTTENLTDLRQASNDMQAALIANTKAQLAQEAAVQSATSAQQRYAKTQQTASETVEKSAASLKEALYRLEAFSEGIARASFPGVNSFWGTPTGAGIRTVLAPAGDIFTSALLEFTYSGFDTQPENLTKIGIGIAGGIIGALVTRGNSLGATIGFQMAQAFAETVDIYGLFGLSEREQKAFQQAIPHLSYDERVLLMDLYNSKVLDDILQMSPGAKIVTPEYLQVSQQKAPLILGLQEAPSMLQALLKGTTDVTRPDASALGGGIYALQKIREKYKETSDAVFAVIEKTGLSSYQDLETEIRNYVTFIENEKKKRETIKNYLNEQQASRNANIPVTQSLQERIEQIAAETEGTIKGRSKGEVFLPDSATYLTYAPFGALQELLPTDNAEEYLTYLQQIETTFKQLESIRAVQKYFSLDGLEEAFLRLDSASQNTFSTMLQQVSDAIAYVQEYESVLQAITDLEALREQYSVVAVPEELEALDSSLQGYREKQEAMEAMYQVYKTYLAALQNEPDKIQRVLGLLQKVTKERAEQANAQKGPDGKMIVGGTPAQFRLPGFVDVSEYSLDDIRQALAYAREKQRKVTQLFPQMAAEFAKEQFVFETPAQFAPVTGVSSAYVQEFLRTRQQPTRLPSIVDVRDIPAAQLPQVLEQARRLQDQAVAIAPQLAEEYQREFLLLLTENNEVLRSAGLSQTFLQYAIEQNTKAVDDNTEELRGHYNLPASYRPPTIWEYYAAGGTEAGAVNYVPPPMGEEGYVPLSLVEELAQQAAQTPPDVSTAPDLAALGSLIDPTARPLGYPEPGTPGKVVMPSELVLPDGVLADIITTQQLVVEQIARESQGPFARLDERIEDRAFRPGGIPLLSLRLASDTEQPVSAAEQPGGAAEGDMEAFWSNFSDINRPLAATHRSLRAFDQQSTKTTNEFVSSVGAAEGDMEAFWSNFSDISRSLSDTNRSLTALDQQSTKTTSALSAMGQQIATASLSPYSVQRTLVDSASTVTQALAQSFRGINLGTDLRNLLTQMFTSASISLVVNGVPLRVTSVDTSQTTTAPTTGRGTPALTGSGGSGRLGGNSKWSAK